MNRPSRKRRIAAAGLALACLAARPARAPAGSDLTAQANQIARTQLKRLGDGYAARIDPKRHIVYLSALDEGHLQQTIRLLAAFTDAYRRTLPAARPAWNVTVVLPTADDYRSHKAPSPKCVGFYNYAGRRLVSIDRGRTLVHEFTHALHHADMAAAKQRHPIWICEGLATLFEASRITPSGLRPRTDGRLPAVQRALRKKRAIPLQRLLTMGREPFMQQAELAYAQSRYVMYYLCHRGRLRDFYRIYKATFTRDPDGVKAFEQAAGNRLFIIERQWQKWVLSLRMPSSEPRSRQGRLGLEVKKTAQGVQVVALVPGSAAKVAGRIRVGDVIQQFGPHAIRNPADLVGAVRNAGALQTVKIQLRRHGRPMTVIQPLGAPSKG